MAYKSTLTSFYEAKPAARLVSVNFKKPYVMTTAEKTVQQMTDYVNNFSVNETEFIVAMSHEHRTLQQSFTRLVFKWLEYCATDDYRHDLRNEATHRISKEVVEAFSKAKEAQMPDHWAGVKPSQFLSCI